MAATEIPTTPAKENSSSNTGFGNDPRWKLVERILSTSPFQKSPNLHGLLSYLAEHSIKGKAEALTERQIGITAFGKPADYSPTEDSAVRVHVRQLRLRLHEYFDQEGRNETQRIDIPKGSYVLEFEESKPETAAPRPIPAVEASAKNRKQGRSAFREVLFWVALAAAAVCGIGWFHAARDVSRSGVPWPLNAVIQQGRQTTVVVSDANLSTFRLLAPNEISLDEYLQPSFREGLMPPHLNQNLARMLTYVSHSELTSFADAAALAAIVKTAGAASEQISLTSARDLDRRDLERGNYIFLGSAVSNPWVSLFADKLNFQVVEEGVGGRMYFRNRNPTPGEQAQYEGLASTGSAGDDFATIAVLPGSIGRGNVLILQGLRQEGTEALGALLADSTNRAQLETAVRKTANNSPYFEALVQVHAVAGAPVSITIVATRAIPSGNRALPQH
jgi:hypothetical protein